MYVFAAVALAVAARAVHGGTVALRALIAIALILFLERSFTPFSMREQDPIVLALHAVGAFASLAVALVTASVIRADPRRIEAPSRNWRPHSSRVTLTVQGATERLVEHISAVVVGKREVTEQLLGALLVEGHVLLDDVPGVGKTTLARAVARSLDLTFRRIQCTPDLVPSDITGVSIYDQRAEAFEYRPGPLSANVVLVDEINRATPRAQSALLEAMQERQVTVDEATHTLPDPFLVIATQNPVELEGTFPLPEAQLDRFLFLRTSAIPTLTTRTRSFGSTARRTFGPRRSTRSSARRRSRGSATRSGPFASGTRSAATPSRS